jgi:hypothetical protein
MTRPIHDPETKSFPEKWLLQKAGWADPEGKGYR